jgi:hypothetical protein
MPDKLFYQITNVITIVILVFTIILVCAVHLHTFEPAYDQAILFEQPDEIYYYTPFNLLFQNFWAGNYTYQILVGTETINNTFIILSKARCFITIPALHGSDNAVGYTRLFGTIFGSSNLLLFTGFLKIYTPSTNCEIN